MRATTISLRLLLAFCITFFVFLPTTTTGRLLGQHHTHSKEEGGKHPHHNAITTGPRNKDGGIPRGNHLQNHKHPTHGHHSSHQEKGESYNNYQNKNDPTKGDAKEEVKEPPKQPAVTTLNKVEQDQEASPKQLDGGSFLIRQSDSMSIYDDFEEIDQSETSVEGMTEMFCTQLETSGSELCFGGQEDTAAFWVHGICVRGRGHTTVSVAALGDDSEIVFACGGSPHAKPSVECSTCQKLLDDEEEQSGDASKDDDCEFPFRAEARFGILTIPRRNEGKCVLICEMPTTNE